MEYTDDIMSDDETTEPENKDRYELILTPTKRFLIIDLIKIAESVEPKNE